MSQTELTLVCTAQGLLVEVGYNLHRLFVFSYVKVAFYSFVCFPSAVFDFHQVVDGLQETERQAQEGKT